MCTCVCIPVNLLHIYIYIYIYIYISWLVSNLLVWQRISLKKSKKELKSIYVVVLVTQSCPTLCDPMDYSTSGSSVHGILQARILQWVAIPFSRGSSQHGEQTCVSCVAGRFFTIWTDREALCLFKKNKKLSIPSDSTKGKHLFH